MQKLLHSKILGQGKPLLILHGYLGMGDNWKTLGNRFAADFQVHLIDQRNHGRSFHSEIFNYHVLASDILHYIQNYELENVYLLGHSMGGKTAMFFAAKYPQRVEKLIIADISPRAYPPLHQDILAALEKLNHNLHTFESRKQIELFLEQDIKSWGVRQFLLKNIYTKKDKTFAFRCNVKILTEKYNAIGEALPSTQRFEKASLFLKGAFSDYIQKQDELLIKQHFPKSYIKTIEGAGHWLHAENPKDFYTSVLDFLQTPFFQPPKFLKKKK